MEDNAHLEFNENLSPEVYKAILEGVFNVLREKADVNLTIMERHIIKKLGVKPKEADDDQGAWG